MTGLYYYASELAIFNFANSDYIVKHQVDDYIIIIDQAQFTWSNLGSLLLIEPDYDMIMVN